VARHSMSAFSGRVVSACSGWIVGSYEDIARREKFWLS